MSETHRALEALGNAYIKRGAHQQRVKEKYANYQRELDEARQEDINDVAEALVAAWNAGATVAATGRAMGAANIYNSRRAYYDRAREIQGEADQDDNELLERLFRQARGEDVHPAVTEVEQEVRKMDDDQVDWKAEHYGQEDEVPDPKNLREWVNSWTLDKQDDTTMVDDPQGRVESIRMGLIHGFKGENMTEFLKDKELADLVSEVHGIETKVMGY